MWLLYSPPVPLVRCNSVHDLPSHADGVLGIWLSGEQEFVAEWLVDLRRHPSHAFLPIFVDCELPAEVQHLSDGGAQSPQIALEMAREWRPSVAKLHGATPSPALALARYLYLRPLVALSPVRDYSAHQAYRYPLLEAFVDGERPESLLDVLRGRGWLEQAHLMDRLRRCSRCDSVHLNYVDVCPGCQSLNIEAATYIHCFSCSHVAPEGHFIRQGALTCPNCHARLRHIGADYNRPLEQMHCHDCAMAFADAKIIARCLLCGSDHDPEKLGALNISAYALSDIGRQAARQGLEGGWRICGPFQPRRMTSESFVDVAEWMMSLSRRHADTTYVFMGLYLGAGPELERLLGEEEANSLIEAFVVRLRELMRDTDILAQVSQRLLWLMLPQTDRAGGVALLDKIANLAGKTVQENGSRLEVRGVIHAASDIPAGTTAEQLLASIGSCLQKGLPC